MDAALVNVLGVAVLAGFVSAGSVSVAHAQVPVVDATTSSERSARPPLPATQAAPQPVPSTSTVRTLPVTETYSRGPAGSTASSPADMFYQLESLQQEVQQLRGVVEEQAYQLQQMREEQRERYLDLDRRISLLNNQADAGGLNNLSASVSTPASGPTAGSGAVSAPQGNERSAYEAAFGLIRNKQYDEAISAFTRFTQDFPTGVYTPNAYYWLGEVHLVKADYEDALKAFGLLLNRYPDDRKIPDAKYKLGKIYRELGDPQRATQYLQDVVANYPGTPAAKLAEVDLRGN